MTKKELGEHVRAIQRAVEAQLPEDEHDDVRPWVYRLAVRVMATRLAPNRELIAALDDIASYDSLAFLRRQSTGQYGLEYTEALEMAYENIKNEAKGALALLKKKRTQEPSPAAAAEQTADVSRS